jgi:hypothetical protein
MCEVIARVDAGSRPLGYESFEQRSAGSPAVRNAAIHPGLGRLPTGSRPTLFLAVSASPVSKP